MTIHYRFDIAILLLPHSSNMHSYHEKCKTKASLLFHEQSVYFVNMLNMFMCLGHEIDKFLPDISPLDITSVRSLHRTPHWFVSSVYTAIVSG
jgi:hypothetical protein